MTTTTREPMTLFDSPHVFDVVIQQIDALPDQTIDDLSVVLDTYAPVDTLRALYRMVGELAYPERALAQLLDREPSMFMVRAYQLATVRAALRDPSKPLRSFRDWSLRVALGAESTDTLTYALQLLERVRPPQMTWAEWLNDVGKEAEIRAQAVDFEPAGAVPTRSPDTGIPTPE